MLATGSTFDVTIANSCTCNLKMLLHLHQYFLAWGHAHSSAGQLSCKYEVPAKLMRGPCDCRLSV